MQKRDEDKYRRICELVLERDGWHCQFCGSMQDLQVHHQTFRSHGGPDMPENLITLCAGCHAAFHKHSGAPAGEGNVFDCG